MSSFTGETKSSSTSENIAMPKFFTNKLPPSTNLPNEPFNKSLELSKKSIQDNPHDQRKDPATCPHARSENGNLADETRFAETAKIEDHR